MKSLLLLLLSAQLSPAISLEWLPNAPAEQVVEYFVGFTVQGDPINYFYSAGNNTRYTVPMQITTSAVFWVRAMNTTGLWSPNSLQVRYTPNRPIVSTTVFNKTSEGIIGNFALTGDMGKRFTIQTSENLQSWTDSYSGIIGQDETFNYAFPVTAEPRKFYRVAFLKF